MKPTVRLPVSAALLAAVFLLGIGLTRAEDDAAARHSAAEALLVAMHTEQNVDGTMTRMLGLVDRFGQSVTQQAGTLKPEQNEALAKAEDEARDSIRKELGYASLKEGFVQAYADAFSEGELKELTAFYSSPIGQKLTEKQPVLNEKLGQIAQTKMRTVMPGVVQKLREVAQKNLPPSSPRAPVAPAPAATGMPAAPAATTTPAVPVTAVTPALSVPVATTTPVPAMSTPIPSPAAETTPSAQ